MNTDLVILHEILFYADYMSGIDEDTIEHAQIDAECIAYVGTNDGNISRWQRRPAEFWKYANPHEDREWFDEVMAHNQRIDEAFPEYSREKVEARTAAAITGVKLASLVASILGVSTLDLLEKKANE